MLQKAVRLPFDLPARHGIQTDGMNTVEDALFDVRVILFQPLEQQLDLLPLGIAASVLARRAILREPTGTLNKFQPVRILPTDDILLMD